MTTLSEVPVTRPFTETDWYGYAGAEPWPNAGAPLITQRGWGPNADDNVDVVADVNGLTAYTFTADPLDANGAPETTWYKLDAVNPLPRGLAELILNGLAFTLTAEAMAALGFEYMGTC